MSDASNCGAAVLRANMRGNIRYRFELLAAISRISREHGVELDDATLSNLVLVDSSEVEEELMGPDLPGGINC
ncbi:hypothetical protein ACJJIP_11270 [Microbulbifer sp. VTAC004]|uniref:hypothetical protein n=1 Tax=Microbulbifer sp. VTAC004 TaxID=3243386 RepID=UPI00403A5CED